MSDVSRLGRGVVIRGSIRGEGSIEIDGRVEGVVDVDGDLTLTESARVRIDDGELSGRRVSIRGAVAGNIRGTAAIVLEDGARVVGDLAAPSIGIRPGGLLRGHVATGDADNGVPTRGRADRSAKVAAARPAAKATAKALPYVAVPPPRLASQGVASPRASAKVSGRVVSTQRNAPEEDSVPTPRAKPARGRAEAPAPVMPSLKKGQKGQLKRKAGR